MRVKLLNARKRTGAVGRYPVSTYVMIGRWAFWVNAKEGRGPVLLRRWWRVGIASSARPIYSSHLKDQASGDSAMAGNGASTAGSSSVPAPSAAVPGARLALALLLIINLFNYIDRQVLASVVHPIEQT